MLERKKMKAEEHIQVGHTTGRYSLANLNAAHAITSTPSHQGTQERCQSMCKGSLPQPERQNGRLDHSTTEQTLPAEKHKTKWKYALVF